MISASHANHACASQAFSEQSYVPESQFAVLHTLDDINLLVLAPVHDATA